MRMLRTRAQKSPRTKGPSSSLLDALARDQTASAATVTGMPVRVRTVPWHDTDAAALRAAQRAEITGRYGDPDCEAGTPPTADDVTLVVVAYDGDRAVGCGALRALDATSGELKRMFVVPDRRGTGVATAVLEALEGSARDLGWSSLRLETGDVLHEAIRFYTRSGYRRIPNFGHYAGVTTSLCFERALGVPC